MYTYSEYLYWVYDIKTKHFIRTKYIRTELSVVVCENPFTKEEITFMKGHLYQITNNQYSYGDGYFKFGGYAYLDDMYNGIAEFLKTDASSDLYGKVSRKYPDLFV